MNVRATLAQGREALRRSATETPDLDAEVLLRHTLRLDRAALYTHPERALSATESTAFQRLVTRRANGEPVAYLVGFREFMGLDFVVDPRVLIPRPDTETLVERALSLLPGCGDDKVVVDVGTGSGAIAISIAVARPAARVYATDTSSGALQIATENARRLIPPPGAVTFMHGSLLEPLPERVDLICANLPYIPHAQIANLPPTVRDYEPWSALDGGPDGLDLYRALLAQTLNALRPGGATLMECDPRQAAALLELAKATADHAFGGKGATGSILKDLAGMDRVVELGR